LLRINHLVKTVKLLSSSITERNTCRKKNFRPSPYKSIPLIHAQETYENFTEDKLAALRAEDMNNVKVECNIKW